MCDDDVFLGAIRRAPTDDTVRLVYADWLDDRGDQRGEFLRVEYRLGRAAADDPDRPALLARWLQLRDLVPAGWVEAVGWRVNRLPLPPPLVGLLTAGKWGPTGSTDANSWEYNHAMMASETPHVCRRLRWCGRPDPARPPGDVHPDLTVLIADEGMGSDAPYALDYRVSFGRPRVLLLTWHPGITDEDRVRWVEVAPDFEGFVRRSGREG